MAGTLVSSVSEDKLSIKLRETFLSRALNRGRSGSTVRGVHRGFIASANGALKLLDLSPDPRFGDSVIVHRDSDLANAASEFGVHYRETGVITLDLDVGPAPGDVIHVGFIPQYTVGSPSDPEWRIYTEADRAAGLASEAVLVAQVTFPAGVLADSDIDTSYRERAFQSESADQFGWQELIDWGGFEQDDGMFGTEDTGGGDATRDTTTVYHGLASARLRASGAAGTAKLHLGEWAEIIAGQTVRLTCFVETDAVVKNGDTGFQVEFYDDTGASLGTETVQVDDGTAAFTLYRGEFIAPATSAKAVFRLVSDLADGSTVYFDGLSAMREPLQPEDGWFTKAIKKLMGPLRTPKVLFYEFSDTPASDPFELEKSAPTNLTLTGPGGGTFFIGTFLSSLALRVQGLVTLLSGLLVSSGDVDITTGDVNAPAGNATFGGAGPHVFSGRVETPTGLGNHEADDFEYNAANNRRLIIPLTAEGGSTRSGPSASWTDGSDGAGPLFYEIYPLKNCPSNLWFGPVTANWDTDPDIHDPWTEGYMRGVHLPVGANVVDIGVVYQPIIDAGGPGVKDFGVELRLVIPGKAGTTSVLIGKVLAESAAAAIAPELRMATASIGLDTSTPNWVVTATDRRPIFIAAGIHDVLGLGAGETAEILALVLDLEFDSTADQY